MIGYRYIIYNERGREFVNRMKSEGIPFGLYPVKNSPSLRKILLSSGNPAPFGRRLEEIKTKKKLYTEYKDVFY